MLVDPGGEKSVPRRKKDLCFPLWPEKVSRILQESAQTLSTVQSSVCPKKKQLLPLFPLILAIPTKDPVCSRCMKWW